MPGSSPTSKSSSSTSGAGAAKVPPAQGQGATTAAQQQRMMQVQMQQQQMKLLNQQKTSGGTSQQQQQHRGSATAGSIPNSNPLAPAPGSLARPTTLTSSVSTSSLAKSSSSKSRSGGSSGGGAPKPTTLGRGMSMPLPTTLKHATSSMGGSALGGATTTTAGHHNAAATMSNEEMTRQLLAKCDWKDKTIWVARQLLGGNATNGFLRATASVQRIKRQRARQTAQSKQKQALKDTTTTATSTTTTGTATGDTAAAAAAAGGGAAASKEKEKDNKDKEKDKDAKDKNKDKDKDKDASSKEKEPVAAKDKEKEKEKEKDSAAAAAATTTTKDKDKEKDAKDGKETAAAAAAASASTTTSTSKKREAPDQASEETLKKEVMNPRTAKKLRAELQAGLSWCIFVQNTIRNILFEMDPDVARHTPLPLIQGGEIPTLKAAAAATGLQGQEKAKGSNNPQQQQPAAVPSATAAVAFGQQHPGSSTAAAATTTTTKAPLTKAAAAATPDTSHSSAAVAAASQKQQPQQQERRGSEKAGASSKDKSGGTAAANGSAKDNANAERKQQQQQKEASPGGESSSTLRKLRKKKLPPSTEPVVELSEFDIGGKRYSRKEHYFRIFECTRFRALKVGDFVAARVSSRDLWILARVQKDYPGFTMPPAEFLKLSEARRDAQFKDKVAIKDVEDKEGGVTMVQRGLVLPLPRTFSEAADWAHRSMKKSRVYAMYPNTTSLYSATVVDNATYCQGDDDILVVEFDGDEAEAGTLPKYHIPARFVTLIPREFPAAQTNSKKRKSATILPDLASPASVKSIKSEGSLGLEDGLGGMVSNMGLDDLVTTDSLEDFGFDFSEET